jgi:hypothetical protein
MEHENTALPRLAGLVLVVAKLLAGAGETIAELQQLLLHTWCFWHAALMLLAAK